MGKSSKNKDCPIGTSSVFQTALSSRGLCLILIMRVKAVGECPRAGDRKNTVVLILLMLKGVLAYMESWGQLGGGVWPLHSE